MAYDIGGVVLSALGGALITLSLLPSWARVAAPVSPGHVRAPLGAAGAGRADVAGRSRPLGVAVVTAALGTWRITRGWSRSRSL